MDLYVSNLFKKVRYTSTATCTKQNSIGKFLSTKCQEKIFVDYQIICNAHETVGLTVSKVHKIFGMKCSRSVGFLISAEKDTNHVAVTITAMPAAGT